MDMDFEPTGDLVTQPLYDFNEVDNQFNFEFEGDFASADPFGVKQEVSPSDDTIFDSPSSSPLPAHAEPSTVVPFAPLSDISSNSEDLMFDDSLGEAPSFGALPNPDAPVQDSSYVDSRDSDSEGTSKRGRKRKAPISPEANEKRARRRYEPGTILSKEELHTMTAEELEEYAQHIQDSNLSTSEKNEIRKQLRLVKNRESAQASRLRKKNYIDDLERRVSALQSENQNLRQNVNSLHNENTQLKTEVVYLKGVVNNSGLSKVLSQGASFFSKLSQQQNQGTKPGSPSTAAPFNARSTGVVLLVMLFSFGLLFNSQAGLSQTQLPGKQAIHEANTGRILNHANYKPTSEVRDVLSVFDQSEMPTQRIRQLVEKQRALPDSNSHKVMDERPAKPSPVAQKELVDAVSEQSLVTEWKANTTYFLCPDVQKLTPPPTAKPDSDASLPMQISFLIPPHALEGGAGESMSGAGRSGALLEVTCQVVDVVSRPYNKESAQSPS